MQRVGFHTHATTHYAEGVQLECCLLGASTMLVICQSSHISHIPYPVQLRYKETLRKHAWLQLAAALVVAKP
jgi:hypothetical protein